VTVCPVFVGIGLIGGKASRPAGLVLLAAFAVAILYLVRASRDHAFLESEEVREAEEEPRWCTGGVHRLRVDGTLGNSA